LLMGAQDPPRPWPPAGIRYTSTGTPGARPEEPAVSAARRAAHRRRLPGRSQTARGIYRHYRHECA
jgi:hypothetical protein